MGQRGWILGDYLLVLNLVLKDTVVTNLITEGLRGWYFSPLLIFPNVMIKDRWVPFEF
jgi:hypothetical protein